MRAALVLVVVAGCIEPQLVACPDGRLCPNDKLCDVAHASCVTADQLSACDSQPDQTPCTTGTIVAGFCDAGVCLVPGCGNHAIEPGEACDDGNLVSGDGCNATCTSIEVCGNGILDDGEQCDDGNRMSHDGCDSLCATESYSFFTIGIKPNHFEPGHSVFDPKNQEVVHFADGILWAWQSDHWIIRSTLGPATLQWWRVVYDPDRTAIEVVGIERQAGGSPVNTEVVVYEWDGTTWAPRAIGNMANVGSSIHTAAAYDRQRHGLFILGQSPGGPAVAFELIANAWAMLPPPPAIDLSEDSFDAAYDVTRNVMTVVVGHSAAATDELEWNGLAWAQQSVPLPGGTKVGFAVVYDPALMRTLVGGGDPAQAPVVAWTGTAWQLATTLPVGRHAPELVPDDKRLQLDMFGGSDATGDHYDVYAWNHQAWAPATLMFPPEPGPSGRVQIAFDDANDRLVLLRTGAGGPQTWMFASSTWTQLDSTGLPNPPMFSLVFDPIRGAVLLSGGLKTFALGATAWTDLGTNGPASACSTFDPEQARVVAVLSGVTRRLLEDGANWQPLMGGAPILAAPTIAYDARNHTFVMVDEPGGATYERGSGDTDTWTTTVSPGPSGYFVVEDRRRGTVWFEAGGQAQWERVDDNWIKRPRLPVAAVGPATYSSRRGEVLVVGYAGTSQVVVVRQLVGHNPDESCVPGEDADGDGLAGCDDPDCWPQCSRPGCPPGLSCP